MPRPSASGSSSSSSAVGSTSNSSCSSSSVHDLDHSSSSSSLLSSHSADPQNHSFSQSDPTHLLFSDFDPTQIDPSTTEQQPQQQQQQQTNAQILLSNDIYQHTFKRRKKSAAKSDGNLFTPITLSAGGIGGDDFEVVGDSTRQQLLSVKSSILDTVVLQQHKRIAELEKRLEKSRKTITKLRQKAEAERASTAAAVGAMNATNPAMILPNSQHFARSNSEKKRKHEKHYTAAAAASAMPPPPPVRTNAVAASVLNQAAVGKEKQRVTMKKSEPQRGNGEGSDLAGNSRKTKRKEGMHSARESDSQVTGCTRYWSKAEHAKFLEGIEKFGYKKYQAISEYVKTRTPQQVRTHSQKFEMRLAREALKKSQQLKSQQDYDLVQLMNTESSKSGQKEKKLKVEIKAKPGDVLPNPDEEHIDNETEKNEQDEEEDEQGQDAHETHEKSEHSKEYSEPHFDGNYELGDGEEAQCETDCLRESEHQFNAKDSNLKTPSGNGCSCSTACSHERGQRDLCQSPNLLGPDASAVTNLLVNPNSSNFEEAPKDS
eukprot:CAMPEP_0182445600 /NCGR_PEP_ID=MMETSP1172-20130603/3675_1 /TAXON_ID=708627 /ORGANISM="Timspurckia oligopyrenoides, Strain CCMP3278" /LENGTH=543 /DNA_ID=CAMNT_0024641403 /DNA_START=267 /DNA_END=1898 /DNA_ORIENTATION=+